MQRIIVKNFGPLKDIDLEIKDYMIFLGPQASGKSTLAKLIYGFKDVIGYIRTNNELWNYTSTSIKFSLNDWETSIRSFFFPTLQNQQNYFIEYIYENDVSIVLTQIDDIINVKLSDGFIEKLRMIENEIRHEILEFKKHYSHHSNFDEYLLDATNEKTQTKLRFSFKENNLLFIPDKRDINIHSDSSFYYTLKKYRNLFKDGFISVEKYLLNTSKSFSKKNLRLIESLFVQIFKGYYESVDNGQIVLFDGKKISLDLASSGQKEVVGILIILTIEIFNRSHKFYVIEEPEAHLFPEAQKDITYLISLLANQEGNQVIITTHSHYILGALNILINAHRIGQTNPEEVEKIVPRELWVDKNRIFAGFLENGIIKDIYDDEAEMIKIQQLNAVAGEINKDFDRLLDLEFANENV